VFSIPERNYLISSRELKLMYDRHLWHDANRVARDVIRVTKKTRREFKILAHTQVNNAKCQMNRRGGPYRDQCKFMKALRDET